MKQHPKRETRLARLSRTCSLILSFLILWFASFHTVLLDNCLLKPKEIVARGETKAASGRRVTGVSEMGDQAGVVDFTQESLNFWSAIFT